MHLIMSVAEVNIAVEPFFVYRTLSRAAAANALVVSTFVNGIIRSLYVILLSLL